MLRQSKGFFEAFKAPSRELYFKLTVNRTKIYEKDKIKTIDVEYGSTADDSFAIGTTFSSGLKIVFSEIIEDLKELDEIHAEIGIEVDGEIEYSSLGYFIISERVDVNRNDNITTVQCLDQMILMDKEYKSELSYPAPISDVALEIANLAGVRIDGATFSRLSNHKINEPVGFSCRQAIGLIAQFEAGFATFNREGNLDIRLLNEADIIITPDEYFSKGLTKNDLRYELGGIAVNVDEDTKLQAGSPSGSQISLENPLMNKVLLNNIWGRLEHLTFYPFTLQWRGNPALEIGDWIYLTDVDGNLFKAPILTYKLTYNGGLTATMSADVESTASTVIPFKSPLEQKVERIQNAIVKANGNVNFYGQSTPPENPKVNDLWFKPNGTTFDMYVFYEKDGVLDWHKEMHDLFGEEVKEAIESAQADIEETKQKADETAQQIDDAVLNAGFTSLSDSLIGIQSIATESMSLANDLSDQVSGFELTVDGFNQIVNDYEGQVAGFRSDINGLNSTVASYEDEVATYATQVSIFENTVDGLQRTVTNVDGRINTLSNTVDGSIQRISDAEGNLTQIEANVNGIQETVSDPVNGLVTQVSTIANGFNVISEDISKIPEWTNIYRVNTDNPKELTKRDGSVLNTNMSYEIEAGTTGTGTTSGLVVSLVFKNNKWEVQVLSQKGTSSNHPKIYVEDGIPKISLYSHASFYDVIVNIREVPTRSLTSLSVLSDNINMRVEKDRIISQINLSPENILLQANKIQALGDVVVGGKLTITDEFIAPNAQIDGAKIADASINSAKIISLDAGAITTGKLEGIEIIAERGYIANFNIVGNSLSSLTPYGYTTVKGGGEVAFATASPEANSTTGAALQIWHDGTLRFGGLGTRIYSTIQDNLRIMSHNRIVLMANATIETDSRIIPQTNGDLNLGEETNRWYSVHANAFRIPYGVIQNFDVTSVELYSSNSLYLRSENNVIYAQGHLRPRFTSTFYLGNTNYRWISVYTRDGVNQSSDIRLKDNVQDVPESLIDNIKDVKPKIFDMNGVTQFGYSAQDVEMSLKVYAESIMGSVEANEYIKKFNIVTGDDDEYKSLMYSQVEVLKGAYRDKQIDELTLREKKTNKLASKNRTLIEELQEENEKLKSRIEELESAA